MKRNKILLSFFALFFVNYLAAKCCVNNCADNCPNILVNKCKADGSIERTIFKQPNGSNVAVDANGNCPICQHPPFNHSCDANCNQIDLTKCPTK